METPKNAVPVLMELPEEFKPIAVESIETYDHIGFIDVSDVKSFLQHIGGGKVLIFAVDGVSKYAKGGENIIEAIDNVKKYCHSDAQIRYIFKFKTRRDLYAWLAE